LQCIDVIVEPL